MRQTVNHGREDCCRLDMGRFNFNLHLYTQYSKVAQPRNTAYMYGEKLPIIFKSASIAVECGRQFTMKERTAADSICSNRANGLDPIQFTSFFPPLVIIHTYTVKKDVAHTYGGKLRLQLPIIF